VTADPEEYFVEVHVLVTSNAQLHLLVDKNVCVVRIELGDTSRLADYVSQVLVFKEPDRETVVFGVCAKLNKL
jgi:hypothetical protein